MAAERDERPLSPHLQIYRLPLNALLSITHRITGLVLVLGSVWVVALLVAAAGGQQAYQALHGAMTSWLGQGILFALTLALYTHLCTGIRHLFWDAGLGFELATTRRTSRGVIVGALALTVLTWVLASAANGS
ncbi:MAG: succinate dehydrogenase, cytochrome b556 subunit [Halofilum sp. (in: g-proteobacteria)]